MNVQIITLAIFTFATSGKSEPTPIIVPTDGGLSGPGITTRYWDCSKPSCSWRDLIHTKTNIPIASCAIDGVTVVSPDEMSAYDNGTAYMCTNQQPFVVNSTLAYGFAAASFTGNVDFQLCCGCVLLSFQGQLAHKKMVVQVTNAGSDLLLNQFDLAMPGGGVGLRSSCTKQWNVPADGWGERYGGVTSEAGCDELPEQLRSGFQVFIDHTQTPVVTRALQAKKAATAQKQLHLRKVDNAKAAMDKIKMIQAIEPEVKVSSQSSFGYMLWTRLK
ncbi:hypothetical protein JTB14_031678 [Gonioctena quinquepunctata]|nr:hypothetical protein JTB14_031678 [Gonioctena quinquepunctata]